MVENVWFRTRHQGSLDMDMTPLGFLAVLSDVNAISTAVSHATSAVPSIELVKTPYGMRTWQRNPFRIRGFKQSADGVQFVTTE